MSTEKSKLLGSSLQNFFKSWKSEWGPSRTWVQSSMLEEATTNKLEHRLPDWSRHGKANDDMETRTFLSNRYQAIQEPCVSHTDLRLSRKSTNPYFVQAATLYCNVHVWYYTIQIGTPVKRWPHCRVSSMLMRNCNQKMRYEKWWLFGYGEY